jgi:hypothetical protein
MSFLDEVLRELKGSRSDIDRAVTDLENEIQDRDEKTARIKEQRELIEELMAARTAPLETPIESPKYIVGLDLAKGPDKTVVRRILHDNGQAELRRMQNDVLAFIQNNLGISPEKFKVELPQEPTPEAQQHDKFGTFKYVNGKMVRICKCELCKKRGIANG